MLCSKTKDNKIKLILLSFRFLSIQIIRESFHPIFYVFKMSVYFFYLLVFYMLKIVPVVLEQAGVFLIHLKVHQGIFYKMQMFLVLMGLNQHLEMYIIRL